jgi:hypothetical protein
MIAADRRAAGNGAHAVSENDHSPNSHQQLFDHCAAIA